MLRAQYDPRWGGFGRAPKFPPASTIEFLLRRGVFDLALGTLDGMRTGGMYDLVGGGFHRYSVDAEWLVPHFEKMLYDNALLVPAYLHAWVLTGEDGYRSIVEETVEYALRELRLDGGGFASAQDADTDGIEGLTFTWTPEELEAAIGPGRDDLLQPFEHGRSIVRGRLAADERAKLFDVRERRPKPLRDDKAIAAWNGLMLAALAESGRRLERPDWLDGCARACRLPARPALERRTAAPDVARRRREGNRLPRGLRERRARPLRAARRHGRAPLALRGAPSRTARGRAVR